ncbi:MAG: bifunctional oligoribonuclease/PAP phosphatase NrnA [Spirochaetales bacterium]|nr:bifunctional oligoribonuclease/PAP phosphatase NrnA [Spirochaetales bacterium]
MVQPAIPEALDFLREHHYFLIVGHVEPDGDCLGAQLGLCSLLERLGKKALALQEGPFDRPETEAFARYFTRERPEEVPGEAVIVLDCSTSERISERYKPLLARPVLVIDHHAVGETFGTVRFVDPRAASTASLVARLFPALGETPTRREADWLFFGLCTDTGFFRHCESGFTEVFETALFLVSRGASPKAAYQAMFGNRSFAQRKLLGRLLQNARSLHGGRLVIITQSRHEKEEAGPNVRSSEELYSLYQTVNGVEVIVFLREESDRLVSVGLRSLNDFDVSDVARRFGGGGHKLASGFTFQGTLEGAFGLMLEVFDRAFQG